MTKDEMFLLKLHEVASSKGDPYTELDRFQIGRLLGLHDRGIDNIVKHLCQANFVKKGDADNAIFLTEHGMRLIELLKK